VKRIRDKITTPKEKTTLYEEIPINPWDEEEWRLYYTFRKNARCNIAAKLKECSVSQSKYRNWISRLDQFALMQPAFYLGGLKQYCIVDMDMEVNNHLLVFVSANTPDVNLSLLCTLYDMKSTKVIKKFSHAGVIYHFQ